MQGFEEYCRSTSRELCNTHTGIPKVIGDEGLKLKKRSPLWHRGADGGSPATSQCEKVVATNVTEGLKDLIGVLGREH